MPYYQKYKTHISKNQFYILISLLALMTLLLLIWVLIPFTIGVSEQYLKANGINPNNIKENQEVQNLEKLTLLSYIANTLVVLFFLVYLIFIIKKLKAGYLFFFSWIVIFITFSFIPFFKDVAILTSIQLGVGICLSIISWLIVFVLIYMTIIYWMQRKAHYYEWFVIHKGKAR
ncbi:hypothetical protein [Mycoplasmopsis gallopavonis]|uniref:Transmembrane protein n=1 Tax=Mycoplasmopsis gallopavonis TaxID=76629 RepID=A0A449AYR6_9BACT|nr:hypothetical protein [Mycoplasmopsis gallopavonis]RIV16374.1 hypothetical protein D1113_02620 [Mycoplasmopsis gallopavonis]VEU72634.1 Uncharacterised protein [Mycoplasmopsis gallopavonis]VEU72901.1 Uncharacterised protein [Mycoplasmopsis gallopavonis]